MDTKRLDLNLLVTLEALLAECNVTRAAARLNLSQPAVSAQLNRLRAMFNDPLLIPAQRGMTPTSKALELLAPLRQTLDELRATIASHKTFDPAKAEMTVAIACTDYLQAAIVKPLVLELRNRAPGIRVAIRNLDLQHLLVQMERGDVDLVLLTPTEAPPSLRSYHLFDERYVLIGRRGHPHLREGMSIADFCDLEHVVVSLVGAGFSTPVDEALATLGYRRRVVLSAASFLFVPEIVSKSDFVALVPERLVLDRGDQLRILECPFPVTGFSIGMMWHERTHDHAGQVWVRETIKSLCSAAAKPQGLAGA